MTQNLRAIALSLSGLLLLLIASGIIALAVSERLLGRVPASARIISDPLTTAASVLMLATAGFTAIKIAYLMLEDQSPQKRRFYE